MDSRILWSGSADVGTNPGSLTVPATTGASDDAILLWGSADINAASGVGWYSRFTVGGIHYTPTQLDQVDWSPGLGIVGAGGWWYIPAAGALLRAGGAIEVNWAASGGSPVGSIAACIVDLGGPTSIQVGASYLNPTNVNYPGYRPTWRHGYGDEIILAGYAGINGSYLFDHTAFERVASHQANNATVQIWDDPDGARSMTVNYPDGTEYDFSPTTGATWWNSVQACFMLRLIPQPGPDAWLACFDPADWTPFGGASLGSGGRSASIPLSGVGSAGIGTAYLDYFSHPGGVPHFGRSTTAFATVRAWPTWGTVVAHLAFLSDTGADIGSGGSVDVTCDGTTITVTETTQWGTTVIRGTHAFDPAEVYWFLGFSPSLNQMRFGAGNNETDGPNWFVAWFANEFEDPPSDALSSEEDQWLVRASLRWSITSASGGDHGTWVLTRYRGGCPAGARAWAAVIG